MKCWIFVVIYSRVSLQYSFMRILAVPVEWEIMMIFAPVFVHSGCFDLSANFSMNRLTGLDSPSKNSGSLSMALLNIMMHVVEV